MPGRGFRQILLLPIREIIGQMGSSSADLHAQTSLLLQQFTENIGDHHKCNTAYKAQDVRPRRPLSCHLAVDQSGGAAQWHSIGHRIETSNVCIPIRMETSDNKKIHPRQEPAGYEDDKPRCYKISRDPVRRVYNINPPRPATPLRYLARPSQEHAT